METTVHAQIEVERFSVQVSTPTNIASHHSYDKTLF